MWRNTVWLLSFSRQLDTAPFCTEADLKSDRMSCSTNRKALTKCNLINYPIQLPQSYQVCLHVLGS